MSSSEKQIKKKEKTAFFFCFCFFVADFIFLFAHHVPFLLQNFHKFSLKEKEEEEEEIYIYSVNAESMTGIDHQTTFLFPK